jgi:hypothetical protein
MGEHKWEDYGSDHPSKNARPYLKNNLKQKGLEMLLKWQSKGKALSSNPSCTKKKFQFCPVAGSK